jgi:hypothetical protein
LRKSLKDERLALAVYVMQTAHPSYGMAALDAAFKVKAQTLRPSAPGSAFHGVESA